MNKKEPNKKRKPQPSTKAQKEAFLSALEQCRGIMCEAMQAVGIKSRTTIKTWRDSDPTFEEALNNIKLCAGDFVESKLLERINEGDTTAIIFYCKTKLKDRGYTERKELNTNIDFSQMSEEQLNNIISELTAKI